MDRRNAGSAEDATDANSGIPSAQRARLVAFYLPQFHPIPENDAWWGRGFTEWINVAPARPLFPGHYQPHVPADLGYYDLRVEETRLAQARLARAYGIEAFCYWHYWFEGRRLLGRPLDELRRSGVPDFPFCLAWANETWSRRWLGEERDILLLQTYSRQDDLRHAEWLGSVFSDTRYLRVQGRPLFCIYRPHDHPNAAQALGELRNVCARQGLGNPYVLGIDAHCPGRDTREFGCDATLLFRPQLGWLPGALEDWSSARRLASNLRAGVADGQLRVFPEALARRLMRRGAPDFPFVPSVFVGWDNTPRRGRGGIVITSTSPDGFRSDLQHAVSLVVDRPPDQRLVFVNAWNEWAEGNHLEPDHRYGHAFLAAALGAASVVSPAASSPLHSPEGRSA